METWRRSRGRQSHRAEKVEIEMDRERKRDQPGKRGNRERPGGGREKDEKENAEMKDK